jgi:peptide/nickel transport system substrate-binding protein
MHRKRKDKRPFHRTLPALLSFVAAVVIFIFLSPLIAQHKPMPSFGDAFVSASMADARVLIPFLADDTSSSGICELVFNGLTKLDKNLAIVGDLAESWDVSDDGLVITFYLNKGVRWHDGHDFTADDVKFTYETLLDPAHGCPYTASYADIENIEILDDLTVRFHYKQPYAPALLKLGMGIIPKHLLKNQDIRTTAFKRNPIGTGPYRFRRWKAEEYMILESNRHYFEHRPYIDKHVTRIIPNQAVQFLELASGAVDSMGLTPYQYHYRTDTKRFRTQFNTYKYLSHSYSYIGYNLGDPLFRDIRVRQALSHAVNRHEIIDGVLMGLGEPCTGPFLKGTHYYSEQARDYPYDIDRAKALLAEAGWHDRNGDGILDKDGMPFAFKLITNQGNKMREDVATIVQRQLSTLGIKVDVQTIAWAAFLNEFIDKKNFQAVILGWTIPTDPDAYNVWHSASAREGGLNFISYKNDEVDRLIVEGRTTFDEERRGEIYRRIHELIASDAPYTFLYFPYATPAVAKRFRGIEPAPAGIGYNFIDWHVLPDERKY